MANCIECGEVADHRHHVIPESSGGSATVPMCAACHGRVHEVRLTAAAIHSESYWRRRATGGNVGIAPYGFRKLADGSLVEDEAEQAMTHRMLVLAGLFDLDSGLVAAQLNLEGFRMRNGKPWNGANIRCRIQQWGAEPRKVGRYRALTLEYLATMGIRLVED